MFSLFLNTLLLLFIPSIHPKITYYFSLQTTVPLHFILLITISHVLYILQTTVEDLPIEQNEGALERARNIAQNPERIEYLPARKLWVVKGTTGADYVVKLFKDGGDFAAQCSCPATIRCCHIMAAMIWLNMDPKANYQTKARKKRESRNVSSMRTKVLPKARRKTGGKNSFP